MPTFKQQLEKMRGDLGRVLMAEYKTFENLPPCFSNVFIFSSAVGSAKAALEFATKRNIEKNIDKNIDLLNKDIPYLIESIESCVDTKRGFQSEKWYIQEARPVLDNMKQLAITALNDIRPASESTDSTNTTPPQNGYFLRNRKM